MNRLQIRLFGSFRATFDGSSLKDWGSSKAEELLCYLMLNRTRPQSRELIASTLWEHATTTQSRAYLRKALWQLRSLLRSLPFQQELLISSTDFIRNNPDAEIWLDVALFEKAYLSSKDTPGDELDETQALLLEDAVELYTGDLLEDYFHEWCLHERERYKYLLLSMLDKLSGFHEARQNYEAAKSFAERSLSHDRAREYTHRQLMRLRYLSGDRTGAVRQYAVCAKALQEELDIEPADATVRLYQEICSDDFGGIDPYPETGPALSRNSAYDMLYRLKAAIKHLAETNDRIGKEIAALEEGLFGAEAWMSRPPTESGDKESTSRKKNAARDAVETHQEMQRI